MGALFVRFVAKGSGVMIIMPRLGCTKFEVFWAVVVSNAVLMVDWLVGAKLTTEHLFHYVAMFKKSLSIYRNNAVSIVVRWATLPYGGLISTSANLETVARTEPPIGGLIHAAKEQKGFLACLTNQLIAGLACWSLSDRFHAGYIISSDGRMQPSPQ